MKLVYTTFQSNYLKKEETLMTIGNGYLGLRASQEESYRGQQRGFFAAGIYNKAASSDSSELVNLPDVVESELILDDELVELENGTIRNYQRSLDFKTGELLRSFEWQSKSGSWYLITSKRLASQVFPGVLAFEYRVKTANSAVHLAFRSGINAQMTNMGTQHLREKNVCAYSETMLAGEYETLESQVALDIAVKFSSPGSISAKNRRITYDFSKQLLPQEEFVIEKIVNVTDSQNQLMGFLSPDEFNQKNLNYRDLYQENQKYWESFWQKHRVIMESDHAFDQLSLDFSVYHLEIMTPKAPNLSVAAKGLTGEGYKGHIFWDTEIFIEPYLLHNHPELAKNMLLYRYNRLAGAQQKAKDYGYQGALFPWESALTGFEETPKYAAINIRTGKRQEIASAIAEHHISADIALSVNEYYEATRDDEFMECYGKTLIQETAAFWLSRAEQAEDQLVICDVIGPDEYTEHIDNNAYTNYLAHFNVCLAVKYSVGDRAFQQKCQEFLEKLYLPTENEDGIVPQDDTFLSKPTINLEKYRQKAGSQEILKDYSRKEVIDRQILKQADVIMLIYLFPQLFDKEIIRKNLFYYEKRTIHDSSLSKAIHAIVAARVGELEWAYAMFQDAAKIDLDENQPHSSDDGIHAASLGALWLTTAFGFGGITKQEILAIAPVLPKQVKRLAFSFNWQQQLLRIEIDHDQVQISSDGSASIQLDVYGKRYNLKNELVIAAKVGDADENFNHA